MVKVLNARDKQTVQAIKAGTAIYIGRPSPWGNPYPVDIHGRERAIQLYQTMLANLPEEQLHELLAPLKDKDLVCWCAPKPCHGHVLRAMVQDHLG